MNNRIILDVDKSVTMLAGRPLGLKLYEDQVKLRVNLDSDDEITIVFPDNIVKLASSFIQAFFKEFVDQWGREGVETRIKIESTNPNMQNEIFRKLV